MSRKSLIAVVARATQVVLGRGKESEVLSSWVSSEARWKLRAHLETEGRGRGRTSLGAVRSQALSLIVSWLPVSR